MKHHARFIIKLLLLAAPGVQAQTLVVNLESGSSESHPLVDIRSITFPNGQMSVNFNDGTTVEWPIADIRSYAFSDLTTGLDAEDDLGAVLRAYPNPTSGAVRIALTPSDAGRVQIHLLDLAGRALEQVFDGFVPASGLDLMHTATVATGPCLLRATHASGTTILPLTIQR